MNNEDYATYGDKMAEVYDGWFAVPEDANDTVSFLAGLLGPKPSAPVLELGIGTGRIALPLARKRIEVHGIDASATMVEKLRAKPGGEDIPVIIGNIADFCVEQRFSLVYAVFNTFFFLLSQQEQVRCFAKVAQHLDDGGVFVIEAFVPNTTRLNKDQWVEARQLGRDSVILDVARHNPLDQRVTSNRVVISEGGIKVYPVEYRYVWLPELDLMARLAGLRLCGRWGGWCREPFTNASTKHISVYRRE